MKNKVFAVLVSYNPEMECLCCNVRELLKQVECVIIVNNSISKLPFNIEYVKIFELGKNYGIAYAQNVGMKWAYENGAEFVLQMDQDSVIQPNAVKELLCCYNYLSYKHYSVGVVGCLDFDRDTGKARIPRTFKGKIIEDSNYHIVTEVISSGSLINKEVYYKVGPMMENLFIDWVDSEFCWRVREKGYLVISNYKALIAHKLGDNYKTKSGRIINTHSPFRLFFIVRNFLWLFWKKRMPMHVRYVTIIKLLKNIILWTFVCENFNEIFRNIFKGIIDGIFFIGYK